MEELLMEMKSDVARLPGELSKMPSVSVQLKMDEISTISKLAKGIAPPPVSQSVITRAPPTPTGKAVADANQSPKAVVKEQNVERKKPQHLPMIAPKKQQQQVTTATKYQVAYTAGVPMTGVGSGSRPQVQVPAGSGLAVQTAEGNLVVYSMSSSSKSTQSVSIIQAGGMTGGMKTATPTTNSGGQQAAYTLGVPTYLDGSSLYQTVQLVPAAAAAATTATSVAATSEQQMVYWPTSVVGTPQGTAGATAAGGTSQLAVIQHGQVLQPVQFGMEHRSTDSSSAGTTGMDTTSCSVITID